MTPEEIRAFLSHGTRTAKVATSGPDGLPHVMPVWFALDGEERECRLEREPCAASEPAA